MPVPTEVSATPPVSQEGRQTNLADQVRSIARENEFLAYSSAGDRKNPNASRHYALRAGVLHLAADALDALPDAAPTRQDDLPAKPNGPREE